MKSDDKRKDDISPPDGYGNRERGRTFSAQAPEPAPVPPAPEPSSPAGPPVTDAELARFVELRAKPTRTESEEVEFAALDARIVVKPPEPEPLTPAEIGKLAEQRADPAQQPDPVLVAREGVPIPEPDPIPPNLRAGLLELTGLVAALAEQVPNGHLVLAQIQRLRARLG